MAGIRVWIDRRFFRSAEGYDQDRAHARLTDINLKILQEANPAEGTWAYLRLAERPFHEHEREKMIGRDCGSHANAGLCVDQTAEESNRPRRHTRAGPSRSGFAPMRASPRVITTP